MKLPTNLAEFKDNIVPGSLSVDLQATGEVLGPDMLSNLDSLLEVPYGCGEQAMLGVAPNVAVGLSYRSIGKFKGSVRKKAIANMLKGI